MKIRIKQEDLLSDHLSWLCIEPILLSVRGKNLSSKSDVYHQLNEGQRALYLFYAFHNHTDTIAEFYWFAAYFIIDIQSWNGLKNGMLYLKDFEMVDLLEQLELIIERKNKVDNIWRRANATDIETDIELLTEVQELYNQYKAIAQRTIIQMNNMIINNKDEHLEIK